MGIKIKSILVPLDGSANSFRGLDTAIHMARQSHGRTGFDKLLLGSVANGVSQKIKCPILIVK